MGERAVGVGAGQQHQHVGPGGERAPRLDAVDHPAALHRRRRGDDAGDVGPVVGLGHCDGGQDLGRGQFGEPVLLLLLRAPVDQGAGQDLGPGDERAADAQRAPAQLLGGHDHAHVIALAAGCEAPVLLGHGESEPAQLGQALDHLFGDVAVLPVHVFGLRADLVLGEAVERLADQLEVLTQVPRAFGGGQAGEDRRIALRGEEVGGRRGPPGVHPPEWLPPRHLAGELGHDVGDERSGDARLGFPALAVLERGPRRGDRRGCVRHVVGDHLVGVDPPVRTDGGARLVDESLGQVDRFGGAGQQGRRGRGHGARP